MKSFLQETAEDIVKNFGEELTEIELIFPNKRTDFHFKKYLGKALNKTSWSPKTFTIQQYICNLTGIKTLDKISLLFELYLSFKETNEQFKYDFDSFYKLGEIILHDFNEIDNYLVDAEQIFTNIKNIHEIDLKYGSLSDEQLKIIKQFWQNFSPEQKSKEKEQFLELWNILPGIYRKFKERLLQINMGFEGMIYKQVAELIERIELNETNQTKIFIGFNALNKAQKKLFKYLKNKRKAIFYWDNDSYYFNNGIQEAGDFLRSNFEILGEEVSVVPSNLKSINKSIKLIGVPGKIGQAKSIPEILKSMCNSDGQLEEPEKTVIVLPDENMLFPVLNSIPEFIPRLNVTMGYPLKNTSLYSLLIYFLRIQKTINQRDIKNIRIYYKDVLGILNHPDMKNRYSREVEEITNEIIKKQMIYIGPKLLLTKDLKIFEEIFTPVSSEKAEDLCTKLLNILFLLFTNRPLKDRKDKSIEDENIYQTYLDIKRLKEILEKESKNIDLSLNVALHFIKQVLVNVRIPFESESTDGLQIMGLIETRNIDFDNIILINANEGILPKLSRPPSLISESMRHAFELPVLKYQDSIFAYFFYRLIQRAKNIHILYDNIGSFSRSGELSRFVYQLELESGFKVEKLQFIQDVKLIGNLPIQIVKNQFVLEKLDQFQIQNGESKKQLSASALDTYISCPFQFFLKYVAGIKEPEEVEEEFSPVEIGIIIHSTMEYLYKNNIERKGNNRLEKLDFRNIFKNIDEHLLKAFADLSGIGDVNNVELSGNLLIIKEVITKYIQYILKFDESRAPLEIIQLEDSEAYRSTIEIDNGGKKVQIAIKGIIDRIDKIGNTLFLIDYKTGKADKEFKSIDELFLKNNDKRKKAIMQIMFYGLLLKDRVEFRKYGISPFVYDVKNMYSYSYDPSIIYKNDKIKQNLDERLFEQILPDFHFAVKMILEEMFNPQIPFTQTEVEENCKYCRYKVICSKQ